LFFNLQLPCDWSLADFLAFALSYVDMKSNDAFYWNPLWFVITSN